MASNAEQYLAKLHSAITSGKIADLKEKQLKRIAAIITGLTILSNPKFHDIIKLQPGELDTINQKLTTKVVADRVALLGTRSPSMLAQNEQNLVHFETRSQATKQKLATQIKQLVTGLANSSPTNTSPTQKEVPLPAHQQSKPSSPPA